MPDVLHGNTQRVGAYLRHDRLVTLAHGGNAEVDLDAAFGGDQDPGALEGAETGGLHVRGYAHAVVAALFVRTLPGGYGLCIRSGPGLG